MLPFTPTFPHLPTLYSAIDSGIKLRPSEEELKVIGPAFTEQWQRVFANAPDKPVLWMGSVCMYVFRACMVDTLLTDYSIC